MCVRDTLLLITYLYTYFDCYFFYKQFRFYLNILLKKLTLLILKGDYPVKDLNIIYLC